jgi:DNA topoisomerase I
MFAPSSLHYSGQVAAEKAAHSLAELRVISKQSRVVKEEAPPPHTTLTMLEDTASKLGWDGVRTMASAQSLFEQGLITYPRTDSTHVAPSAKEAATAIIRNRYGANSLKGGALAIFLSAGKDELGAHEAIRPADPMQLPEHQAGLLPDQAALYGLVWERFVASQMKAARYQVIDVELESV